jgi:hypothetical protein
MRSCYQVTVLIETNMKSVADVTFGYEKSSVNFLFAQRSSTNAVEAQTKCDADTWTPAVTSVIDTIIPPILDIIAFHRHTPMLLKGVTQVQKAEPGNRRRRAILINTVSWPVFPELEWDDAVEINQLLSQSWPVPRPAMRWLRNAFRPLTTIERFMFAWLAFEQSAGSIMIYKKCRKCGGELPPHPASNRSAAYEMLSGVPGGITKKKFEWLWFRLRNVVFHGGKEPDSELIGELREATTLILEALNHRLLKATGVDGRLRTTIPIGPEQSAVRHHFIEFDTDDPSAEFSGRVPKVKEVEACIDGQQDLGSLCNAELRNWNESDRW